MLNWPPYNFSGPRILENDFLVHSAFLNQQMNPNKNITNTNF